MIIILLFTLTMLAMAQLSEPKEVIVEKEIIREIEVVRPVLEVIEKPVIEYVDRPVIVEREVIKEAPQVKCKDMSNFWEGEYYRLKVDTGRRIRALEKRRSR